LLLGSGLASDLSVFATLVRVTFLVQLCSRFVLTFSVFDSQGLGVTLIDRKDAIIDDLATHTDSFNAIVKEKPCLLNEPWKNVFRKFTNGLWLHKTLVV